MCGSEISPPLEPYPTPQTVCRFQGKDHASSKHAQQHPRHRMQMPDACLINVEAHIFLTAFQAASYKTAGIYLV